ncbi:MAG TPA: riboflavin synthase [Devosiaceae bacterium]|jgi:riboflavin synthase|nr:riboflavin synthase [Devosiaceae bacterium]
MFSGIIERVAPVKAAAHRGGSLVLELETGWDDLALGESVAVNGVCLTVTGFAGAGGATFFVSPESLARTNLGKLAAGTRANLERSVRLETRLSGHLVQGHVDGKARLVSITPESGSHRLELSLPAALARYCVEKGSIALDGISLTINSVGEEGGGAAVIGISIIPHTWEHTNLNAARAGDEINVEVDVMAKYVERLCQPYL